MAFNSEIKGYMTFGKSFSRGGAFPLEAYEIWTDYDALVAYAANTDPSKDPSYIGQKVAYVDVENNKVTHYGIEIDGSLKELGSSPIGDEKSIVVTEDGTVSLAGIDGLVFERDILGEDGQPTGQKENVQFQPLMTKDGLIWVEPSKTTVEGLASLIDGLTARVSALENDRVTEEELAAAVKAETDRATAAEEALGKRIDEIDFVDDDELAEAIEAVEAKIPTNNNQLENGAGYQTADDVSSAITTAITDKADKANTLAGYDITDAYTKDEVDTKLANKAAQSDFATLKGRVDAFLDGTGTETALDSLQELITYINEHDDVELADIIADIEVLQTKIDTGDKKVSEFVEAAIEALKIGDYAKAADLAELAGRVITLEAKPFDTYATKSEVEAVDTKFAGVVSNDTFAQFKTDNTKAISDARTGAVSDVEAKGYAVAATVQTELDKKIETAQIRYTSEGVGEGVTKDGTALTITIDAYRKSEVYTKSETDSEITKKITSINGGESAGEVKSELVDYRDALNEEIWGQAARSWTTKVESDGKTIVTYTPQYGTTSRIDTLASDVATAQTQANKGVDDAKAANDAIATLTGAGGRIATIEADVSNLKSTTDNHGTTISDHATRVAVIEAAIADGGSIDLRFDTLEGFQASQAQVNKDLNDAIAAKLATDTFNTTIADYHTKTEVATLLADKADKSTIYTKDEVDNLLKNFDQTELENGIKVNADALAVLVGSVDGDDKKSVRTIAKEEVAAVVGSAPEALDTLEEVATWINNDQTGAAAMASDIAALKITVGDTDNGLVKAVAANTAAIAAIVQPKSSTEISVAANGTLGINEINVNKLVQTEGDTLVLNGGSAK